MYESGVKSFMSQQYGNCDYNAVSPAGKSPGYGVLGTSTGVILVLFILLVIILAAIPSFLC